MTPLVRIAAGNDHDRVTGMRLTATAALSIGVLVTACSGGGMPEVVLATSRAVPPSAVSASATGPAAAWAADGALELVTWGSGFCPNLPTSVEADGTTRVSVKTEEWHPPGTYGCTADLTPTTSTVRVPDGIDVTSPVTVTIDGQSVILRPTP